MSVSKKHIKTESRDKLVIGPGDLDVDFKVLATLLYDCTQECGHCSVEGAPNKEGHIEGEDIIRMLTETANWGERPVFYASGGEGTLHPMFREIMASAQDLGFLAIALTNLHWIVPGDAARSREKLENKMPFGTVINFSYDWDHLIQDPRLPERVDTLKGIVDGDYHLMCDGGFYGPTQYERILQKFPERTEGLQFIPIHNVGRAKGKKNDNQVTGKDAYCPKWKKTGFMMMPDGVYYCCRSAFEHEPSLKLADKFDVDVVAARLAEFDYKELSVDIKKFRSHLSVEEKTQYHNSCDMCLTSRRQHSK